MWRHIAAPLAPAELWRGFGGDGINETCGQEPHFAVARGDVLLHCKLFSPKISQRPSRQGWWRGATCHLWPATPPLLSALHLLATLMVTTQHCKNAAYCPQKQSLISLLSGCQNLGQDLKQGPLRLFHVMEPHSESDSHWIRVITVSPRGQIILDVDFALKTLTVETFHIIRVVIFPHYVIVLQGQITDTC